MYHTYMYEVVGCLGSSLVQFSYCASKLKAFLNHEIYECLQYGLPFKIDYHQKIQNGLPFQIIIRKVVYFEDIIV